MNNRELLIDDLKQMEDSLIWIEENRQTVSAWGVLRAVCRAVLHLLTMTIKKMDDERRNKNA